MATSVWAALLPAFNQATGADDSEFWQVELRCNVRLELLIFVPDGQSRLPESASNLIREMPES